MFNSCRGDLIVRNGGFNPLLNPHNVPLIVSNALIFYMYGIILARDTMEDYFFLIPRVLHRESISIQCGSAADGLGTLRKSYQRIILDVG